MRRKRRDWCVLWRLKGSSTTLSIEEMRVLPKEALLLHDDWFQAEVCGGLRRVGIRLFRVQDNHIRVYPDYYRVRVTGAWARDYDGWGMAKTVLSRLLAKQSPVFTTKVGSKMIEKYLGEKYLGRELVDKRV